jgi:hypothetical protein
MILSIFLIFFAIAIITISLGYAMLMDALRILGATILILLGAVFLLQNNLEIPNGSIITVNGSVTTITPQYEVYSNHTMAFFFAMIGIVLFIFVLVDRNFMRKT